jgi:serine/threonine-protein kinase RIO1
MVKMWAEKEFRNLNRLYQAGIPCPKAILLRQHVLVMSFIGEAGVAAPRLKVSLLVICGGKNAFLTNSFRLCDLT